MFLPFKIEKSSKALVVKTSAWCFHSAERREEGDKKGTRKRGTTEILRRGGGKGRCLLLFFVNYCINRA